MCWHIECSTFTASFSRSWNTLTGILSTLLALSVVMFPKARNLSKSWQNQFYVFLCNIYYFHLCFPSLPPTFGKYNHLQVLIIRTVIIRVDIVSIFFNSMGKRKKQKATKPNGAILLQSNANLQVIKDSVWTHFLSLFLVQNTENSWPLDVAKAV